MQSRGASRVSSGLWFVPCTQWVALEAFSWAVPSPVHQMDLLHMTWDVSIKPSRSGYIAGKCIQDQIMLFLVSRAFVQTMFRKTLTLLSLGAWIPEGMGPVRHNTSPCQKWRSPGWWEYLDKISIPANWCVPRREGNYETASRWVTLGRESQSLCASPNLCFLLL